jgi:hypothetical protein
LYDWKTFYICSARKDHVSRIIVLSRAVLPKPMKVPSSLSQVAQNLSLTDSMSEFVRRLIIATASLECRISAL